jgi:type VI secretion system secreted protein VgrG
MSDSLTKISIGGQVLNTFSTLTLNQSMYNHHTFDLVVGHDIIEDLGGHVLDKSKTWIGKEFVVEFGDNEFNGIVTSITMDHNAGFNGDLIISGASHTILLEAGPHLQSWNKKTLKKIAEGIIAEAGIKSKVAPKHSAPLEYMAQYQESHFGFLQRLAATFHEWMYYDGKTLVFGKPGNLGKEIEVVYGTDLDSIQISMRMVPVNRKGFTYNSGQDETVTASTTGEVPGLKGLGSEAMSASMDKFSIQSQGSVLPRVSDKSELEAVLKNKQAAAAARLTSVTGVGKKMELKPGAVADIKAAVKTNSAWDLKPYGKYLILNIQHHFTGNHEYSNHFEAIPAELEILPEPRISFPVAESQIATVTSNTDPENKGRVEVQFLWQSGDMKSPWLRVTTPDAGTSGKVSSNRGMVTIPEVGDQVMVGFRYNDPMRPFVLGSLFHGKSGGGGGAGNKTKSLTTRSGCTVSLDDDKGSVTISDPSGNTVVMHGDGKMSITAPNELSISSKVIKIEADDKILISGVNEIKVESMAIIQEASTSFEITSGATLDVSSLAKKEHHLTYELNADATVDINGTAMTNVKGGMVNLN